MIALHIKLLMLQNLFKVIAGEVTLHSHLSEVATCRHSAARDIFLETVVFKHLPRQTFYRLSAPTDWFLDDIGKIEAFDCKRRKPSKKTVYGYKLDVESCGKPGTFVMFTRQTIPIMGMKLYINIFCLTTYANNNPKSNGMPYLIIF